MSLLIRVQKHADVEIHKRCSTIFVKCSKFNTYFDQTVFWNLSYFDKPYFEGVFGEFVFPDGTKPVWETLSWLQKKLYPYIPG